MSLMNAREMLLLSLTFVSLFQVPWAIRCYICDNYSLIDKTMRSEVGCVESDTQENLDQYKSDCSTKEYDSCMKSVHVRYRTSPESSGTYQELVRVVFRDCAKASFGNGCLMKTGSNSYTYDCYCNTDYCNTAHISKHKLLLSLFSILLYVYAASCQ